MKRLIIIILLIFLGFLGFFIYERYFLPRNDTTGLLLYGNVDVREVDIGFRVSGQVTELLFEEGDKVSKGVLLAKLDEAPYNSQVTLAEANLKTVKANLDNARILFKRREELVGDGSIAIEDLNNAKSTFEQLLSQYKSADANLRIAIDNLNFTKTYAPVDGIILTRIREPGTVVREADPVYTISISSPVWIRAFVSEIDLGQVNYGMEATITTDDPKGHSYRGKVGFISPIAEFTPKTVETTMLRPDLVYRLRIYVDKPDSGLRQGMPVTIRLLTSSDLENE